MASYTSVSLMSTSAWNGPGGSPIISPSRWNALVASNLTVLANHNHSGSAGEGGFSSFNGNYPIAQDVQYIYPWFPVTNQGWVMENRTDWPGMGCMSTSTLGAILEYDVYMRSGVWELDVLYGTGSANGFLAFSINGSPLSFSIGFGTVNNEGVLDTYYAGAPDSVLWRSDSTTASFTYDRTNSVAGIPNFASQPAGRYKIKIRTVDNILGFKSAGYIARIGYMALRRTG